MVFYVNGSVRHPVFDCEKGKYYGRITDILLDDGRNEVLAYICRTRFFRPRWVFGTPAVVLANKDLLLIDRKGKRWLALDKALRNAWRDTRSGPKIQVFENDKSVGEIADFAFESDTGQVVGIIVSRSLLGKLVFVPRSSVSATEKDKIIVKEGSVTQGEPPKEPGNLANGLLKAAVRGLGAGVAKARVVAKERSAGSLLGKTAPADIVGSKGELLAAEGDRLTPEIIKKLEDANKLSEASMVMMGKRFGAALAAAKKRRKARK